MIKADYDKGRNVVTIEFKGKIDVAQAERFYPKIQKIVPKHRKGFKLLTDFTLLEQMDIEVQNMIKKTMDFFNKQGVTEIVRVVPTPEQDFGFNIMSIFHYSRNVKTLTLQSREEAEERLKNEKKNHVDPRTDLSAAATKNVTAAMNAILADVFALYLKTKNFHWHMSGSHFRDYHLLLDEQADQLYAMTDPIAERVRKIGGSTLKSIGQIARTQRVLDNDADYVQPLDMLAELCEDNKELAGRFREAHNVCDEHGDVATASLIEVWIDETERRVWFLFEASQKGR